MISSAYRSAPRTRYQELLGTLAGIHLHAGQNCSSSAWRDASHGISVPGNGSPTIGADGSNFRGTPVAQCRSSGTKRFKVTGVSGLFPAGSRPWIYAVCRYVDLNGTVPSVVEIGTAAVDGMVMSVAPGGGGGNWRGFLGATTVSGAAADNSVHGLGNWGDGANVKLSVDLTISSATDVAGLPNDVAVISIGTGSTGDTIIANVNVKLVLIAKAYPGLAIATAIHNTARYEFNF